MTRAVRMHETGGPEVLRLEAVEVGPPGRGEVRLRQTAVGLNFIDTYHRSGLYPVPGFPSGLGLEAAGVVAELGPDVAGFAVGDRVGYGTGPLGAYAEERCVPAEKLVALPDDVSDREAAALLLKGMTVQYLIRRCFRVEAGQAVLFHAAAGATGSLACRWLAALGAVVIGTVGSPEKRAQALAGGCHHVLLARTDDVAARVRELTDGRGVACVFDGVGAATFELSLDCLARRGTLVSFGNASGPVPPFAPALLAAKGSLYVTRPTLFDYTATRAELEATAADVFAARRSGALAVVIGQEWPLADVAEAHRALSERATSAASVLVP